MAERTFDCVVIGSGPGGYVAAIRAAQLGMSTAVVERGSVGGRCLNVACIPAKAVLRTADILTETREAAEFGIVVSEPSVDFAAVVERRDKVVSTLTGGVAMLFRKNKIELIAGDGRLTAAGTVRVGDDELSAKTIVVATGSMPRAIPGLEFGGRVVGTEEAWAFDTLPARLAVVGAGPSGSEIASAYARLGSETHLFEVLDRRRLGDGRLQRRADVHRDDVGALLGQTYGLGAALAARGTGDEGDLALDASHEILLELLCGISRLVLKWPWFGGIRGSPRRRALDPDHWLHSRRTGCRR